jgi:excinuclease ABC subunit C
MEKVKFLTKDKISQFPKTPGVYFFLARRSPKGEGWKKDGVFIYIGKAINLRDRVKQHQDLLALVEKIGYIETGSEIEALILEAKLIKKYQPKYNTAWRDDKNYFYVVSTKEDFPKVLITHQPKSENGQTSVVGPFVDGGALKETLKILRRVFPYRTCNRLSAKPCLWYQLDRCPAPCLFQTNLGKQIDKSGTSIKKECQKNAKNLMVTLANGKFWILKELKKEMAKLSKEERFERAAKIRNQIESLEKVFAHAPVLTLDKLNETKSQSYGRAEAYDIANIQGKTATGSMITFIDGEPAKNFYRQFKIKTLQSPNDIGMLKEVLSRRFKHKEWPLPDLILIDGGKAQLNIALKVKNSPPKADQPWAGKAKNIKVVALAKKNNELYIEGQKKPVLLKTLPRETANLILRMRDEAHRFAQRYHHFLRKRELINH